jgi:pectate lyase
MNRRFNLRSKVSMSLLVLSVALFSQCRKDSGEDIMPTVETVSAKASAVTSTTLIAFNASSAVKDAGYSYVLKANFGVTGDSGTQPTISTVRIFENGVEIGPAHSAHADIRTLGKGRFSHWGSDLYFSASDNSDPRTNGKKYTYSLDAVTVAPTPAPATTATGYAATNGMTTGGAGGQTVTVTTLAALKNAAASTSPMIIQVSGTITGTGSVIVKSNKTIVGLSGATLSGVGLRLFGTSTSDYVKNIIIQNLKIKNVLQVDPATGGSDNDCIGLKYADHVWVDHCELSADLDHADWEYYDGLIDITKQSDYVTVSWSKLMNNWKGTFVGGISDVGTNKLHVTFHHNLFNNLAERGPAFIYSTSHVYNNYYLKSASASGYSVGSRYSSKILVENNYFDSINTPIITNIESLVGYVSGVSTNIFKNCGATQVSTSDPGLTVPYEYKSTLTPAADVPAVVLAGAGAK